MSLEPTCADCGREQRRVWTAVDGSDFDAYVCINDACSSNLQPEQYRRKAGLALLVAALALLAFIGLAGPADAAEGPLGDPANPESTWDKVWDVVWNGPTLPGQDCTATPPKIQDPRGPWSGAFMAGPAEGTGMWSERGTAGLQSFTFDTGCGLDPDTLSAKLGASVDTGYANRLVQVGLTTTAMADYLDRASWDPSWITAFLGDLSRTMVDALKVAVFLPWIAIGLIGATIMLLLKARSGAVSLVAAGSAWSLLVVVLAVLVLSSPLLLSQGAQSGTNQLVGTLYGGQNPATAVTDRTMEAVHFQGLTRRTFGTDPSEAALEALPGIYESVGWTWEEREQITNNPERERELWEQKMTKLNEVTGELKAADPAEYEDFTGTTQIRADHAMLEAGYAISANVFRIFAALLRIVCVFALFFVGIYWLCAAPYLVLPQGEGTGRGLLNASARAIGYAIISVVASFGFGIWAFYAMAPTVPTGTSILLLIIGTVIFWSATRPDRKLLSLATGGRVQGFGGTQKWLMDKLGTYLAVRAGTEHLDEDKGKTQPVASEDYVGFHDTAWDGVVEHGTFTCHSGATEVEQGPVIIDGEAEEVFYRREVAAEAHDPRRDYGAPASDVSYGEVELYRRPVDAP